jgi:Methyltransferase domain
MSMVEKGHLGGYVIGGDQATYYPELWTWIVEILHVSSVIDVGCGEGHATRFFHDHGCEAVGIDGVPQTDELIVEHDFTWGPYLLPHPFDLCWSCEFVEHVEERYARNFLETFRYANMVIMTHAEPGQAGYHHVNCRTADYWVGAMAASGFALDEYVTETARNLARLNDNPYNHFARSGMVFVKDNR